MDKYLETPHGWYTVAGRNTLQNAIQVAREHRDKTGQVVALRYVPLSYPECWKAIAKVTK